MQRRQNYWLAIHLSSSQHTVTILQHHFTEADGAWDVSRNLSLSGEPLIDQLTSEFDRVPNRPMSLLAYHEHVLELKDYRARYQAYWNSTSSKTSSGTDA